jgi:hypothetical protein
MSGDERHALSRCNAMLPEPAKRLNELVELAEQTGWSRRLESRFFAVRPALGANRLIPRKLSAAQGQGNAIEKYFITISPAPHPGEGPGRWL